MHAHMCSITFREVNGKLWGRRPMNTAKTEECGLNKESLGRLRPKGGNRKIAHDKRLNLETTKGKSNRLWMS